MCCGKNRAAARAAAVAHAAAGQSGPRHTVTPPPRDVTTPIVFELVGAAPSTVRGEVTGTTYRFAAPGTRLRVDPRDRPGLLAIPSLRWVR